MVSFFQRVRESASTDPNLTRGKTYAVRGVKALPSATLNYVIEKAPVFQWLPRYKPRWVLNDVLAGLTVGALLIPQALAYAKIATIPGEFGLMSSWLPNLIYFIMGTSKDLSTGPTSLLGLLTAEIIKDLSGEGYKPQVIASAVALSVGVYGILLGLLKLGFVLEYISTPVLTGFISAAGLVILLGQVPSLFGIDVGSGTANIIHDLVVGIPKTSLPTLVVGVSGIALLIILQKLGQKWGKKNKVVWFLAIGRSTLVLAIFTAISFFVNKNIPNKPLFAISKVQAKGINAPKMPDINLVSKVFTKSLAPFIAAALEHLAIAKGFGRKNNYVIDQSQELLYLGVANFFNSFFSSMSVGGAMSRTAVNSECGVQSPAYGLVAAGFVLLAIFELTGALFWIPKATLAAIIVTAVWHVIGPSSLFYKYWKTSFVDFVASMIAFWVTLFVSTEMGIAFAVGFSIVYHLLRSAFSTVTQVRTVESPPPAVTGRRGGIPDDTQVFRFEEAIIFSNAFFLKGQCFDAIQTYNSGSVLAMEQQAANRNWSVSGERRLKQLRSKANISYEPQPIEVVVLDMSAVIYIDTTGLTALSDLKTELKKFGGESADLRFYGMHPEVRDKFEQFGWSLCNADEISIEARMKSKIDAVYPSVIEAIYDRPDREWVESTYEQFNGEKV